MAATVTRSLVTDAVAGTSGWRWTVTFPYTSSHTVPRLLMDPMLESPLGLRGAGLSYHTNLTRTQSEPLGGVLRISAGLADTMYVSFAAGPIRALVW